MVSSRGSTAGTSGRGGALDAKGDTQGTVSASEALGLTGLGGETLFLSATCGGSDRHRTSFVGVLSFALSDVACCCGAFFLRLRRLPLPEFWLGLAGGPPGFISCPMALHDSISAVRVSRLTGKEGLSTLGATCSRGVGLGENSRARKGFGASLCSSLNRIFRNGLWLRSRDAGRLRSYEAERGRCHEAAGRSFCLY